MSLTNFWDVTPCSLVDGYYSFEGSCRLHPLVCADDGSKRFLRNVLVPAEVHSITTHKNINFVHTGERNSDFGVMKLLIPKR
jgi:hypothetical protein